MKIILAKSAGFCFGVRRAVELTEQTAAKVAEFGGAAKVFATSSGRESVFLAFFSVFAVVKKSKKDIFSFAPIRLTDEAKRPQVRNPFRE